MKKTLNTKKIVGLVAILMATVLTIAMVLQIPAMVVDNTRAQVIVLNNEAAEANTLSIK